MDLNPPRKKPLFQRFQEKLAESRFLTFSLLLHAVLVVLGGSVVLFKQYIAPPDFVAEGGVVGTQVEVPAPDEQPPDLTQQPVAQEVPTVSAPTVSAIVSTSMAPTTFAMMATPVQTVKAVGEIKMTQAPRAMSTGLARGLPASMGGRAGGKARQQAMQQAGGKEKSEKAVLAGLRWLKTHQNEDGSWSGDKNQYRASMTGLALLCFLGHGETPESPEFGPTLKKALDWTLKVGTEFDGRMSLTKNGFPGNPTVYEHAILTYAIGEYYTMTKDERYVDLLTKAVTYIVQGQAPDGGWLYAYAKNGDSDTSVSGWQIQALKAAHLSELKIAGVDAALDKAMVNLKRVQGPKGGFGYRKAEDKYSLAGVGVLCTYFWKQDKDKVVKDGIEFILEQSEKNFPVKYKDDKANLYAWYYHTQACLMYGGTAWSKWNKMFQDEIADSASPDGSWPATGNANEHVGKDPGQLGAVYRTTLCILMLEVFYRYMPSHK